MMKYSKINELDVSNGEGIGVALFVQGCHFHCPNCFNQETWDLNEGKMFTYNVKSQLTQLIDNPHVSRLSILGGEPLADENVSDVSALIINIRNEVSTKNKDIWVYTGYTFEEIYNGIWHSESSVVIGDELDVKRYEVLDSIDILVDGRYVDELKDVSLKFRGSSNQRIIDVQKSLKEKHAVLYME